MRIRIYTAKWEICEKVSHIQLLAVIVKTSIAHYYDNIETNFN